VRVPLIYTPSSSTNSFGVVSLSGIELTDCTIVIRLRAEIAQHTHTHTHTLINNTQSHTRAQQVTGTKFIANRSFFPGHNTHVLSYSRVFYEKFKYDLSVIQSQPAVLLLCIFSVERRERIFFEYYQTTRRYPRLDSQFVLGTHSITKPQLYHSRFNRSRTIWHGRFGVNHFGMRSFWRICIICYGKNEKKKSYIFNVVIIL